MYRVGIDIGGTFTDMLLVNEDGTAAIGKTLTTPTDPSLAVENALKPVLQNGTRPPGARHSDPWHNLGDKRANRT
jgi:N-methylhydantoinase A